MREKKLHWVDFVKRPDRISVCGRSYVRFASMKRKVTCKHCAKHIAGYKGESK